MPPPGFRYCGSSFTAFFAVGCVMQNSDAVNEVERLRRERERKDVSLKCNEGTTDKITASDICGRA